MSKNDFEFELEEDMFWKTKLQTTFWLNFVGTPFPEDNPQDVFGAASVDVTFAPEGRGISPLTSEEINLIEWLRVNHDGVANAVLSSLVHAYPTIKKELQGYDDGELDDLMPPIDSIEDLKPLISLQSINVHQVTKEGVPYLGFEFDCVWEEEHGLGVLMNGLRTVEIGGSETACLLWIAKRDSEKP